MQEVLHRRASFYYLKVEVKEQLTYKDKNNALLYTALRYGEMHCIGYKFVLGRKGKEYHIQLRFPHEAFFHLSGMQHLTDITYPSKNKERIYKEIIHGNLTYESISKSQYFQKYNIKARIEYLSNLESMLDSCELAFLINPKEYVKYTRIKADYLFEKHLLEKEDITLYLFLIKESQPKVQNECRGCSFFRKHEMDFTRGSSKTTILLAEKYKNVDTDKQENKVLYRNPAYMEK